MDTRQCFLGNVVKFKTLWVQEKVTLVQGLYSAKTSQSFSLSIHLKCHAPKSMSKIRSRNKNSNSLSTIFRFVLNISGPRKVSLIQGLAMSKKICTAHFLLLCTILNHFHHEIQLRHGNRTGLHRSLHW